MPNYQQGKIYKIIPTNTDDDICYVGSTTRPLLCQRMVEHRKGYKRWKGGKCEKTTSFELFEKYGIENCVIELIEIAPCNSKDELIRKEGQYIRLLNCVNKKIAGRTKQEYYEANRDTILKHHKEYHEANRDTILKNMKEYREANREKILEKKKEYHEANRDTILKYQKKYREANRDTILKNMKEYCEANREKILEQKKEYYNANKDTILEKKKGYYEANREKKTEKYTCICGSTIRKDCKLRHEKTLKHMNYCASVSVVP
jgi:hypothetical protein